MRGRDELLRHRLRSEVEETAAAAPLEDAAAIDAYCRYRLLESGGTQGASTLRIGELSVSESGAQGSLTAQLEALRESFLAPIAHLLTDEQACFFQI